MMKIFVWRNGLLGVMSIAFAESEVQAQELLRSCSDVSEETFRLEFANPPEVYTAPKAFVYWADVFDIDESATQKESK